LDIFNDLLHTGIFELDNPDAPLPQSDFLKQRVNSLCPFLRTHVPFEMAAFILLARNNHDSIGTGFKGFDEVWYIYLSRAGQTDFSDPIALQPAAEAYQVLPVKAIGAVKNVYVQRPAIHSVLPHLAVFFIPCIELQLLPQFSKYPFPRHPGLAIVD
jgi:hypothetical protein